MLEVFEDDPNVEEIFVSAQNPSSSFHDQFLSISFVGCAFYDLIKSQHFTSVFDVEKY